MAEQECTVSLHQKIADRSGQLQLLVAALSQLAQVMADLDSPTYDALREKAEDDLMCLIGAYGPAWLDECAVLLKELYNRKEGP